MRENKRIYLVLPPNITRRAREDMVRRFSEADLDAPEIHAEMLAFASGFGREALPALTVSAYPQIVLNALAPEMKGRFAEPQPTLPPLRKELAERGLTPPAGFLRVVAVVPGVLAASSALSHRLVDWKDLCAPDFPHPVGCPPADTPLPYLAAVVMRQLFGNKANVLIDKLDIKSNPIDINKRIASNELLSAVIIPAFARTFRGGAGRMVWPASGALAVPLMACLAADAAPVAHDILKYLLSEEFQNVLARDGLMAPARPGAPGFEELEQNAWNIYWPGWETYLDVARIMRAGNDFRVPF